MPHRKLSLSPKRCSFCYTESLCFSKGGEGTSFYHTESSCFPKGGRCSLCQTESCCFPNVGVDFASQNPCVFLRGGVALGPQNSVFFLVRCSFCHTEPLRLRQVYLLPSRIPLFSQRRCSFRFTGPLCFFLREV